MLYTNNNYTYDGKAAHHTTESVGLSDTRRFPTNFSEAIL